MRILITGAKGFIAKNLITHLSEREGCELFLIDRSNSLQELSYAASQAEFIFHLAGINRPDDDRDFEEGNLKFTESLTEVIKSHQNQVSVVFSSSIQATQKNAYGQSKRKAELALLELGRSVDAKISIFRLQNVFGKWARPNYNSVVATFCHNVARDLPIRISDPETIVKLVYIDDVVAHFLRLIDGEKELKTFDQIEPSYQLSLGELAKKIKNFRDSRRTLVTERVGTGITRALYSTYLSYLPNEKFSYKLPEYGDERGMFVEILKTKESGQFSFFTALPGVTRGGHYHHSKTEKFLVVRGNALFRFLNLVTGEYFEIEAHGGNSQIVETVPGWTHDITNVGKEELTVLLWANEVFDPENPDTYSAPLEGSTLRDSSQNE